MACGQNALEDAAARLGGPVLVCDTDAFAVGIWNERYLGSADLEVDAAGNGVSDTDGSTDDGVLVARHDRSLDATTYVRQRLDELERSIDTVESRVGRILEAGGRTEGSRPAEGSSVTTSRPSIKTRPRWIMSHRYLSRW